MVVHRADRPQQRRLHVLREQRVDARGVPRGREIQRVHEAAGREAGAADVRGHAAAALQRGDPRVQGADGAGVRLLFRLHGEGRVSGVGLARVIARVAFGSAVAVAVELQRAGVAQNQSAAQGRPGQDGADHARRERGDHHGEDAAAAVVPIHREVAAVQAGQVARLHVAPVGLRLGVGVVGELQHGAAEEHAGAQRAPRNQAADLRWRHVVPNKGLAFCRKYLESLWVRV